MKRPTSFDKVRRDIKVLCKIVFNQFIKSWLLIVVDLICNLRVVIHLFFGLALFAAKRSELRYFDHWRNVFFPDLQRLN